MSREKHIEEKAIEEMAKVLKDYTKKNNIMASHVILDDYAEALYNAGCRKQEWISVDERLPETDNKNTYDYNVLVFIPKRDGCRQHGMFLGKLKHSEAEDGSKNFWNIPIEESEWTVWGWSYFEHPVVTHWMPLPEAPKMKGGVG